MNRDCPKCRGALSWRRCFGRHRWVCPHCGEIITLYVPLPVFLASLLWIPAMIGLVAWLGRRHEGWIVVSLIAMGILPPLVWTLLTRVRVVEDHSTRCAHCGYDLTGLPLNQHGNAVCPECSQEDWL